MNVAQAAATATVGTPCPLFELKAKAAVMRANFSKGAREESHGIWKAFKKFLETSEASGAPHDPHRNLSCKRMPNRAATDRVINASDVELNGEKYLLFGCPEDATGAGILFDAALQHNVTLFVSLLESSEATHKFNNYWTEAKACQIASKDGWVITAGKRTVLAECEREPEGERRPQIIETRLFAKKEGETRELTHLHYEGWRDRNAMPHEGLFAVLNDRIDTLQAGKSTPFAINCHGGVGRTGTTAVSHYCRKEIARQFAEERSLKDISLNISDLVFQFRKQRDHFLGEHGQLANVFSALGNHVAHLEMRNALKAVVPGIGTECADVVFSFTEFAPNVHLPCPSLVVDIEPALLDSTFADSACKLGALKACFDLLQKDKGAGFEALKQDIANRFQAFLATCVRTSTKKHDFRKNLVGKDLNANHVSLREDTSFILQACWKNGKEVGKLFDAALAQGSSLFVSMQKSKNEMGAKDRLNNFWQKEELRDVRSEHGWKFKHLAEKLLLQSATTNEKLVETTLQATWMRDERAITHLHYEGWEQDQKNLDPKILAELLDRIEAHQAADFPRLERHTPVVIGSRWGVGRNGVVAVTLHLRAEIRDQLAQGVPLDEIQINIPKAVFEFRKQRNGFVEHGPLLESVYVSMQHFYESLKTNNAAKK